MKKIIINGEQELKGTIRISGAKNAAVAIIPAAILADEETTICNIPFISPDSLYPYSKSDFKVFPLEYKFLRQNKRSTKSSSLINLYLNPS